jgi:hypothetical protein
MPVRIPEPFNDPDWIWELKYDGFRSLAHIEGHTCTLISRNGHTFHSWPNLGEELAHAIRCDVAGDRLLGEFLQSVFIVPICLMGHRSGRVGIPVR